MNTFFFGYLSLKWRRLIRTLFFVVELLWIFIINVNTNDPFISSNKSILYIIPILLIPIISWVAKPFVMDNSTFIVPKFFKHLVFLVAIGLIPLGFEESYRSRLDWEEFLIYLSISFILIFFLWQGNYFKRNKS